MLRGLWLSYVQGRYGLNLGPARIAGECHQAVLERVASCAIGSSVAEAKGCIRARAATLIEQVIERFLAQNPMPGGLRSMLTASVYDVLAEQIQVDLTLAKAPLSDCKAAA